MAAYTWQKAFLAALEETAIVSKAAKKAKITRSAVYVARNQDEEFAKAWDTALELGIATLEDEAIRRARDGVLDPVYQGGERVGSIRKYSDTLLIFLLKTRKPGIYNPPQERWVSGPERGPITITGLEGLSDDDLDGLIESK
jgi:hypothetical protein